MSCCDSKLTVSDSLLRGNSAPGDGGAIFSSAGSASLTQSDFMANAVGGSNATGALVYLRGVSGSASVDVTRVAQRATRLISRQFHRPSSISFYD